MFEFTLYITVCKDIIYLSTGLNECKHEKEAIERENLWGKLIFI